MASLLPLLHDLLPMIIPSEPHVIRATEPACVEELAEAPPWYQISSAADGAPQTGDTDNCQESTLHSETDAGHFEPIRLRDHEETHAEAHLPNSTRQQSSLGSVKSSQQISEPRVFRQDMMAGITDKMGATVLTVNARSASAVHHHGEQDVIIFAAQGNGILLTSPTVDAVKALRADLKGEAPSREEEQPRRIELYPGDFAFVPAWTEHQIVNEHQNGHVKWVIFRQSGAPVQVDLSTWGGTRLS